MGQTSITQGEITIATSDTSASTLVLSADNSDDAGDDWQFKAADGGAFTLGNDTASAGTFVPQLALTPHATTTSSITAISGQLTAMGDVGIGTASPDYELDVAGNIGLDEYIYHNGDADTFIRFQDDDIVIKAGNVNFIKLTEDDSQDQFICNDGRGDLDFIVRSPNESLAVYLNAGNEVFHINHGESGFKTKIHSTNGEAITVNNSGVILNEDGHATNDFRVESDGETHALFVDAGANELHINSGETAFLTTIHNVDGEAVSVTDTEVVINDEGLDALDFRVESVGESEALFLDASANTLYINKNKTGFTTVIKSTNEEAIRVGASGVILNQYGHASNDFRVESDNNTHMLFVDSGNDKLGVVASAPEATLSIGSGKHIIAVDQDIRYAHSGDNTVIVEVSGVKIPAYAIITGVTAIVKTASNLSTHLVNVQMSTTSGTSADSSISSGTELLGASAGMMSGQISSDSSSPEDIDLVNDPKEVWYAPTLTKNGSSDQYLYVCNAGTGNGTTNSSAGTLTIIVEYYGMD